MSSDFVDRCVVSMTTSKTSNCFQKRQSYHVEIRRKMKFRLPSPICLLLLLVVESCCGFVLMTAGARAFETSVFEAGGSWSYSYNSTVLMNEKGGTHAKDVGFYIAAEVVVDSLWEGKDNEKLLRISFNNPKLHIRSRKAPTPEGFTEHKSLLEALPSRPFYIHWNKGRVEKLMVKKQEESVALVNLKKAIASLLQFQVTDDEQNEVDASGHCKVSYSSPKPMTLVKSKRGCTSPDLHLVQVTKPLLATSVTSKQSTIYEFHDGCVQNLVASEKHAVFLAAREEMGNEVIAVQELKLLSSSTTNAVEGGNFNEAFQNIVGEEGGFESDSLLTEVERISYEESKNFFDSVKASRDSLKEKHLGTVTSARSFLHLVGVARRSKTEDIVKALKDKKNEKILPQLFDVLGYTQTSDSHSAAMKRLRFEDERQNDVCERYLWALSVCSNPNPEIALDLLNKFKKTQNVPEKMAETMILSVASMAYHMGRTDSSVDRKVRNEIETTIVNHLDASRNESRHKFLRALRNLRSPTTVPKLLEVARTGTPKEGVLAWKALSSLEPSHRNDELVRAAVSTFFQLDRRHDSSARTLALDVLLSSEPSDELLAQLLRFLVFNNDVAFEVKQYLLQKLRMTAEADEAFGARVDELLAKDRRLNNYAALAQKGLSVALSRRFLGGESSNGSLLTVQEMHGGIVKRGIVNVVLDKEDASQELFSIGIFTNGLSSFVSQGDGDDVEDEIAIAGMELSILGTQIRPFVFFNGQGELMGHVWSGTASEKTTAFQALAMLQDHLQYLRLGSGFIAELDLKGCTSVDLSGQIQISLWNRNAESLIEKSAGVLVLGLMKIDSTFVRSQVEFSMAVEPKLRLETMVDFYSGLSVCIRVDQPETSVRTNVYKIERIPGSKHRLRKSKTKKYPVMGRTYLLNKKNSDMCRAIHK